MAFIETFAEDSANEAVAALYEATWPITPRRSPTVPP